MTKPNHAIEVIKNSDILGDADFILCGFNDLEKATPQLAAAVYEKHISPNNCVKNVFGVGEQNKFFYCVNSFIDNLLVKHEIGTGYAFYDDDVLKFRRFPLMWGKNSIDSRHPCKSNSIYTCPENSISILYSHTPENYFHLFFDKNCTIVSVDKLSPRAVQIDNYSVLGRLDGNVGSILMKDINTTVSSIKQNVKNSLYYDQLNDTIQFYDGKKWRSLKWVDEEKAE